MESQRCGLCHSRYVLFDAAEMLAMHCPTVGRSRQEDVVIKSLSRCPDGIEQLILNGYELTSKTGVVYLETVLGSKLASLTQLELIECGVRFREASIACLSRLRQFSLRECSVIADGVFADVVTQQLTNVTSLDLVGSVWFDMSTAATDNWQRPARAMTCFKGWPDLQVLKIDGSNLIDQFTSLHVPTVEDPSGGMGSAWHQQQQIACGQAWCQSG